VKKRTTVRHVGEL